MELGGGTRNEQRCRRSVAQPPSSSTSVAPSSTAASAAWYRARAYGERVLDDVNGSITRGCRVTLLRPGSARDCGFGVKGLSRWQLVLEYRAIGAIAFWLIPPLNACASLAGDSSPSPCLGTPTRACSASRSGACPSAPDRKLGTSRTQSPVHTGLLLARGVGLEPTTLRLTAECSAD